MRPGQQNKRGRGRNNNNNNNNNNHRKGGNPLSRTYDSSGPDVKIRGTAQHIAEKYGNLARDAQSSGDNVMAENYLQHAEHYNRIVAAAQAQMQERYQRDDRDNADREGSNEREEREDRDDSERNASDRYERAENNGSARANGHDQSHANGRHHASAERNEAEAHDKPHINGSGPQPVIEGVPAEVAMGEETEGEGSSRSGPRRRGAATRSRRPRRSDATGEAASEAPEPSAKKPARRPRAAAKSDDAAGTEPGTDPVAEVASE